VDRAAREPIRVGDALFDPATGGLLALGPVEFPVPLRIDLWRAPTSNDTGLGQEFSQAAAWRRAGLDALQHDTRAVRATPDGLQVEVRTATPGRSFGVTTLFTWTAAPDGALGLTAALTPYGPWPTTWPRAALRLALPARHDAVEWYGLGPGEGYPDSREALRLGRYAASVTGLQTPYVYPQENGARPGVRRLDLLDPDGTGLRITADGSFGFTARPWTSEDLDRAGHTYDLAPGPHTVVTLDAALDGLGSASCGPGPLEKYRLHPRPLTLTARLAPLRGAPRPS
jgi:beta-galactosidase